MTELVLERTLAAGAERVFAYVTRRENVLTWWGPEGATLPDEHLDLSRPGPWFSVFVNSDGRRYKVSGQVTTVRAPSLVAFTWGWHDEADRRGPESHVTIEITETRPGQSRLVLRHRDLTDDNAGAHERGWNSTLDKLQRLFPA